MDNDDLRRGRPTAHRAFDVARATRAGYEMVALAARVLAQGLADLGCPASAIGKSRSSCFAPPAPAG